MGYSSSDNKNEHRYDDIKHMSRPKSLKHPPMSSENRAAQFAAFAALTGYGEAIDETKRLTDSKIELDENEVRVLDEKLGMILSMMENADGYESLSGDQGYSVPVIFASQENCVPVTFTYFVKDPYKAGGEYVDATGYIKKVDALKRVIHLVGGEEIPIDDVIDIYSDIFRDYSY